MTEWEIRQEYRLAKDKKAQIKILAEINGCKTADIRMMLKGMDIPKERKHWAISDETRQKIKEEYGLGRISQKALSEKHGVSQTIISKIVRGIR